MLQSLKPSINLFEPSWFIQLWLNSILEKHIPPTNKEVPSYPLFGQGYCLENPKLGERFTSLKLLSYVDFNMNLTASSRILYSRSNLATQLIPNRKP